MSELLLAIALLCKAEPGATWYPLKEMQVSQKKCAETILSCTKYGEKGWQSRLTTCLNK